MIGNICYSNEKEVIQTLYNEYLRLNSPDHVSIISNGNVGILSTTSSPLDSADGRMYEFIYIHGINNGVQVVMPGECYICDYHLLRSDIICYKCAIVIMNMKKKHSSGLVTRSDKIYHHSLRIITMQSLVITFCRYPLDKSLNTSLNKVCSICGLGTSDEICHGCRKIAIDSLYDTYGSVLIRLRCDCNDAINVILDMLICLLRLTPDVRF
jgi:hypothetical protein